MRLVTSISALVLVLSSVSFGAIGDPPSWDIIDADFGNGSGEVSYLAAFPDTFYGSGTVSEVLTANMTTVTHATATTWAQKNDVTLTGNSFTFEVRFRQDYGHRVGWTVYAPDGTTVELDFKNPADGSHDKFSDDAAQNVNMTVDRGVMNTYRAVYDSSTDTASVYLNGSITAEATITAPNKSTNSSVAWVTMADFHTGQFFAAEHFKLANGAYPPLIPEPATLVLLLGGLGALLCKRR